MMTRSLRLVTNALFSEFSCSRLEVQCDSDNLRSRALARRVGFQREDNKEVTSFPKDVQPRRLHICFVRKEAR